MIEEWTFSKERAIHFREWLNLSMSDLKWTTEHNENFDEFWELFFHPPMQLKEIHLKFYQLENSIKTGTLRQWVRWLRDRFNCYLFVFENVNLRDLALDSYYRISDLAYLLRNFLIAEYPEYKKEIDDKLNIGNYLSDNLYISFEELVQNTGFSAHEKCRSKHNLMNSLEVPFFEEFKVVLIKLREPSRKLTEKSLLSKVLVFNLQTLKYISIFVVVGGLLVWGIKSLRKWNDWYLTEKIKISVPSFYNEKLLEENTKSVVSIIASEGVESQLDTQAFFETNENENFRESPESDLVITSLQDAQLPMKSADFDTSDYEEAKKGGFRDYNYGRSRAYRLMINSLKPKELVESIALKLKKLTYKQADNVVPGKKVPGGNYYNIYVKNDDISDFLESFDETKSSFFISKTPTPNPKGMSHLFIWIKKI